MKQIKKSRTGFTAISAAVFALLFVLLFALLLASSCGDDAAGNLLGISAESPVYTGYKVRSGTQIDFTFSTTVKVLQTRFQPDVELNAAAQGGTVTVTMNEDHSGGEKFIADMLVEDSNGNTLSVLVPFRTRNGNVPPFVINEIRFDYAKPRSEFIELKIKGAGNLGALRLFITSALADKPVYEFPPVWVKNGDYVILHLRTLATDNAVDELGNDLTLASSAKEADTPRTARDLWVHTDKKLIHKTDVIYILDQDDKIIDGIVVAETESAWKKNNSFAKAAGLLARDRAWLNKDGLLVLAPQFEDAVRTVGTTVTKTLCRSETKEDSNTSSDWYIAATSNAGVPGGRNN